MSLIKLNKNNKWAIITTIHILINDYHADRYDNRARPNDHSAHILKSMHVDDPVFDGSRGPKDFIDWESSMNS